MFTVGSNGAINAVTKAMTAALNDPWSSVTLSAADFAPPGAALATGKQNGTQLNVFVVGNNNRLRYFWAVGTGWQGPDPDMFPDGVFSPGGKLAALTHGNNLHVYLLGAYGPSEDDVRVKRGEVTGRVRLSVPSRPGCPAPRRAGLHRDCRRCCVPGREPRSAA